MAIGMVQYEGTQYDFPDEATDEQVLEFLGNLPKDEPKVEREPLRERAVIKKDEGVKKNKEGQHIAYRDSEKRMTGGRGHLLSKEEKVQYPKGTVIPDAVVKKWFNDDMEEADRDLTALLEEHKVHVPDEAYDVLLNMTFNMGKVSLRGFKDMWKAVEVGDWQEVSRQMLAGKGGKGESKYLKQVGNRATRLAARMAALAPAKEELSINSKLQSKTL